MNIEGSVVFITGGASGLGEATVRKLHSAGAQIAICDLNVSAGTALAEELANGALFVKADVSSEESVAGAIVAVRARFHRIDVSVCCAGILIGEKIIGRESTHDLERFRRVINVNLIGTFNVLSQSADAMRTNSPNSEGERGVIVTTSSIAAFEGQLGQSAYAASKAGVAGLTLPAARELAREGIRVCCLAPGIFDTPMLAGLPDKIREALGAQVPFPSRLGKPSEYAATVQHVIENPILNGEIIRLDGAMRMAAR